MIELFSLWLPVLVSAVFVFIVSSLVHMVLPWHKKDYPKLPMEDKVLDALRPLDLPAGDYMIPRANDMKEMRSPEFIEKRKKGPVLIMTVVPKEVGTEMGTALVLWFLYGLVISHFTAYVLSLSAVAGEITMRVFRIATTVSFLGYALALWQISIWYRRSWLITVKSTVDGLMYAIITGATFYWLWPR